MIFIQQVWIGIAPCRGQRGDPPSVYSLFGHFMKGISYIAPKGSLCRGCFFYSYVVSI